MNIKQINNEYDLKINSIIKNESSTDGNVYMLVDKDTKYVMKIYDNEDHVKSMINLHRDLKDNGINVPEIILNKSNNGYTLLDKERYYVIYSFLNGKSIGNLFGNIDSKTSIKIARVIKRMHQVTSGSNKYNLPELPFATCEKFNRYSVLHFDLTRDNIFYNEDWQAGIGLIDFDDAKYGPTIIDVAIVVSLLYFSKSRGVDREGLKAFIDEYYSDKELRREELPYLKKYALRWINYIIENNQFDSSTTDSFKIRKNLIGIENL